MIWKLTPQQERQIHAQIPTCCNWVEGSCIRLDMPCPQQLCVSRINCTWFRRAVLPGHPELYKSIIKNNGGM